MQKGIIPDFANGGVPLVAQWGTKIEKTGKLFSPLLVSDAHHIQAYRCPVCGHIELFAPNDAQGARSALE